MRTCSANAAASVCSPGGEIGRHKGLKIPRLWRIGSSPIPGTTAKY